MNSRILFITPPFTQLNTPYPATAYLKGFLNKQNIASEQLDLGIETTLKLFSKSGLEKVFKVKPPKNSSPNILKIYNNQFDYIEHIDHVIDFLQGKYNHILPISLSRKFLPEASRFQSLKNNKGAFKRLSDEDKAKHICTLFLEDIGDYIKEMVDPDFGFSRYAEQLGRSANEFDEIENKLQQPESLIEEMMLKILKSKIVAQTRNSKLETRNNFLVCFSVPFPGNLFAAFRCAQFIKKHFPEVKTAMGGGFANTELRSLSEKKVFDYFDFITLDDGERPHLNLLEHLDGKREIHQLKRTFALHDDRVCYFNGSKENDFAMSETGTPDYTGLPLKKYISVIEITNPMHQLWSNHVWNKLTLAHGCYWKKCTFCDISLDYISRYEPAQIKLIVDRMEEMMRANGINRFHFVDEAAPPALMKDLAIEILNRRLEVVWWTNIRFEKTFTFDLCLLLAASGCIAVSGGLEVASDRLLNQIEKGVTVKQVARVCRNFTDAGMMVHAYLMYGFPSQTDQETIDSLEMVRQMFDQDIIQSGFWHRFALTVHSPVGKDPQKYGVVIKSTHGKFANNDLEFVDMNGGDHEKFSRGLAVSLYNYMNGQGIDLPLQKWFDKKVPATKIAPNYIEECINTEELEQPKNHQRFYWLGGAVEIREKGEHIFLTSEMTDKKFKLKLNKNFVGWDRKFLELVMRSEGKGYSYEDASRLFLLDYGQPFELFFFSHEMDELRNAGLIFL